ncbi:MAG TPA: hypothetical protein VGK02_06220 [Candidatus Aquicultor sp.]|jgi:hypothetical protein
MVVPFSRTFEQARSFDKAARYVLYIATALAIIAFFFQLDNEARRPVSDLIDSINSIFIVAYGLLVIITNYIIYEASVQKRMDFIDNSFATTYSEESSKGYFSNDEVEQGIYKMAVNGFENALFTYNVSKRMLKPLWIQNALIGVLFILFAFTGQNNAFIMLLKLVLPIILFTQAVNQTLFVGRVKRIYENYRRLFQDLKNTPDKEFSKTPEILINVIEYEATLSWSGILLNTDIYNSLNEELSSEWETMKERCQIR